MKFLFQPVKPFTVFQGFGENQACIDIATGKKVIACNGLNPPTGYKSVYSQMKGHSGLDVFAKRWQPCYASQDGIVEEVVTEEARGLGLGIITHDMYPCKETGLDEHFKVRYWHFIAMNVEKGDLVKVGDLIGYCDSTGYSSGDHLHFELKPVRKNSKGVWYNILQDNGFFGAIDPTPYMEDIFALEFAGLWRQVKELVAKFADFFSDKMRK